MFDYLNVVWLLIAFSGYAICQTDFSPAYPIPQIYHRVAFVFAGSPRSFLTPYVRKSIKLNLLESFCPRPDCTYDVFARVSTNDNNHIGVSAKGVLKQGTDEEIQQIKETILELQPPKDSGGKLYTKLYGIGTPAEKEEMVTFGSGNFRHHLFLEFDPRRYSMYYGRWAAYDMAVQNEIRIGKNYTWIVHVRLDAAWGDPIKPVHLWSPAYLYAPDVWWADIPDTFALLPRNVSDMYFSMDIIVEPGVMCLGGPNFDPRTINTSALVKKGYSSSEIEVIQKEDCRLLYKSYPKVPDPKTGITWTPAGFSEYILLRKLKKYGFKLQDKIQLASLFMYIVRYPNMPMCNFIQPDRLIPWVKTRQAANAALPVGCTLVTLDLKRYNPITSTDCKITKIPVEFDAPSISDTASCLLKSENTDFNFMPFRIRSKKQCLNYYFDGRPLNMTSCINYYRYRFMETYYQPQLFYFYPLINQPQKIRMWTTDGFRELCLSADYLAHQSDDKITVSMSGCHSQSETLTHSNHMFIIDKLNISRINNHEINIFTSGNLKPLTAISIRWNHPKTQEDYCLFTQESRMILRKCRGSNSKGGRGQVFIIERTRSWGKPYRPGITVGPWPNWGDGA